MEKITLEHSQVKVVFDVTADEFEKALDKSFEKNNKNVSIKGFRKGQAPRSVFEKTYGVESLFNDALDFILNDKAVELYKDEEIAKEICGQLMPNIEGEDPIERNKDFKVSFTFDVYPEVTLPKYKGLEVKKANVEVTEEELNNVLENLRKPNATKQDKEDETISLGDIATFDFKGFLGEEAFEGGEATNYELKIGSHQFIPGFEEQMVGMKKGETKDLLVTFPENYGAQELAGKEAKFVVTVHNVQTEVLPELNDEFVKTLKIENVETVEALKEFKKNELLNRKEVSEKDRQVDELINNILDNAVVDMPQSLNEERIYGLRSQYEQQAKMYNIPFEQFLQLMGTNKEQFEAQTEAQGKRQALFNVVITKLIEVENLAPSKEAMDAHFAELGKDTTKLTQEDVSRCYSDLAYKAVVDFLLANAVYTD